MVDTGCEMNAEQIAIAALRTALSRLYLLDTVDQAITPLMHRDNNSDDAINIVPVLARVTSFEDNAATLCSSPLTLHSTTGNSRSLHHNCEIPSEADACIVLSQRRSTVTELIALVIQTSESAVMRGDSGARVIDAMCDNFARASAAGDVVGNHAKLVAQEEQLTGEQAALAACLRREEDEHKRNAAARRRTVQERVDKLTQLRADAAVAARLERNQGAARCESLQLASDAAVAAVADAGMRQDAQRRQVAAVHSASVKAYEAVVSALRHDVEREQARLVTDEGSASAALANAVASKERQSTELEAFRYRYQRDLALLQEKRVRDSFMCRARETPDQPGAYATTIA